MEAFVRLEGVAAPIDRANVDTDQISPSRFSKQPRGEGYAHFLFHDWRFDEAGAERPEFVLNQRPYRDARILVAGRNFACGSSRETAVWMLFDFGVRAVIAPSFGDIFAASAAKNGVLAVVLPERVCSELRDALHRRPGSKVAVDLERQLVLDPGGGEHHFDVDPFRRECLLKGLDDIDLTLSLEETITRHEVRRSREHPWLKPQGGAAAGRGERLP